MNKTKLAFARLVTAIVLTGIFLYACSKGGGGVTPPPPNPCTGITISVSGTVTDSDAGSNNGSIAASATGGSGSFTFNIDGGSFQSSGTFNNLAKGSHTIAAKDSKGCTGNNTFTVGEKNPCTGVSITLSATPSSSDPCISTGSITASASGSTGFTFSLNSGAFQASPTFNNVAAGNHSITAKDNAGCTKSVNTTVGSLPAGPLFISVRSVIQANCALSGCHVSPAPTGGIDFMVDCNIVINKDRIKARAVDGAGTPNQMPPPPNPSLSQADRDKITNWINAGGRFSN